MSVKKSVEQSCYNLSSATWYLHRKQYSCSKAVLSSHHGCLQVYSTIRIKSFIIWSRSITVVMTIIVIL